LNPRNAILGALLAALLFGASTPFAKMLAGDVPPIMLAGLLYLGSGIGLWALRLLRVRHAPVPSLSVQDWMWFLIAVGVGGVLGPVLLMYGLQRTPASSASLLLNLEAVFTALIAWIGFRENTDRRLILGMLLIVAGGAVLAWPQERPVQGTFDGFALVTGACLCWGLDNNLTRKVSGTDADFIAGTKGLIAGITNFVLALALGMRVPSPVFVATAATIGLLGYGASLALFVLALRALGSARAGAYFSTAPFLGAVIAILVFHEPVQSGFLIAALLMASGVLLHVIERHSHEHTHAPLFHSHPHLHDLHHRHGHDFPWGGTEPHTHTHHHESLTHKHPHYPDLHHRHDHK
jgi:drug/metabolite transporter (DMT)-like permease